MSIKLIAMELYRAQQKVNQLEKAQAQAPEHEKELILDNLRKARAE